MEERKDVDAHEEVTSLMAWRGRHPGRTRLLGQRAKVMKTPAVEEARGLASARFIVRPEPGPPSSGPAEGSSGTIANHESIHVGVELMPAIRVIPYVKVKVEGETEKRGPWVMLNEFSKCYNVEVKEKFEVVKAAAAAGPDLYKYTIVAELRGGEGIGATISEARALAAEACLKEISHFLENGSDLRYRPIVTTDPHKDILYILEGIRTDYGLKKPRYRQAVKSTITGEVICNCYLGKYITQGRAMKYRVAVRRAAVLMYNTITQLYNSGSLSNTTYQ